MSGTTVDEVWTLQRLFEGLANKTEGYLTLTHPWVITDIRTMHYIVHMMYNVG